MNRVAFRLTARNTPPLFGAGLIDGLSNSELEQSARDQPRETRGRVRRLKDGRLGRFGWKAQVASLEDFVLTACANELGLEVPGHHQAVSPAGPRRAGQGAGPHGRGVRRPGRLRPELAAPRLPGPVGRAGGGRRRRRPQAVPLRRLRELPHRGPRVDPGHLQRPTAPRHGRELSDSGAYYGDDSDSPGAATPREWRTPPLWGFRDTAPYLHDGRARNLEEAVALHDGQGEASALRFRKMSDLERSQVETFLNSLVAPAAPGAPHRVVEAVRHPANQPGADPAPPPGHGAARRGSMLGGS